MKTALTKPKEQKKTNCNVHNELSAVCIYFKGFMARKYYTASEDKFIKKVSGLCVC